jgi:hypothetical protein
MRKGSTHWRWLAAVLLAVGVVFVCLPDHLRLHLRARAWALLEPVQGYFGQRAQAGQGPPAMVRIHSMRGEAQTSSGPAEPEQALSAREFDQFKAAFVRLKEDNQRLREKLNAYERPEGIPALQGVSAFVIGRRSFWDEPLLGLDKGLEHGVRKGAGVVYRGTGVGRIVSVGPSGSCLALLDHPSLSVAARLQDCRAEGELRGFRGADGRRGCYMKLIAKDLRARAGELVVSSGLDGSFPAGCWLGKVARIEHRGPMEWHVEVTPAFPDARRALAGKVGGHAGSQTRRPASVQAG